MRVSASLVKRRLTEIFAQAFRKQVSYSQNGEDAWVIQNLINQERDDIIVMEVGAFDPFRYSNSYALERSFGAQCFLIEPTLSRAARIAKERASAHVFPALAGEEWNFGLILGDSAISGDPRILTPEYIDAWNLSDASTTAVPTFPVSSLQSSPNIPHIDFLSIDVQGSELEVLKGLDLDQPVGAICIELEGQSPARDSECRRILMSRNFQCEVILGSNEIWVNPNYERWNLLSSVAKVPRKNGIVFCYLEPSMKSAVMSSLV